MGGIEKFSFHTPDICRRAFTKEYGISSTMSDRTMQEWRQETTPGAGTGRATRVLRLHFPTDLLSVALEPITKSVTWIELAPVGGSTIVDLMFLRDSENVLRDALTNDTSFNHTLLAYKALQNGEAFAVTRWLVNHGTEMLRMPASHGHTQDLIVSPEDPGNTGRPVRLTTYSNPNVGDLMDVWEFGASTPIPDEEWKGRCDRFRLEQESNECAVLRAPHVKRA